MSTSAATLVQILASPAPFRRRAEGALGFAPLLALGCGVEQAKAL